MTAHTRPQAAVEPRRPQAAVEFWQRVPDIRREWLDHGLATTPADRTTAERCITAMYARLSRRRPRFVWVRSPQEALPLVGHLPTHDVLHSWVMARRPAGAPPLASDLATAQSRLRGALDDASTPTLEQPSPFKKNGKPSAGPPVLPPLEALKAGVPLRLVLRRGVTEALRTSLADGFFVAVRAALAARGALPVCWYGQQDAAWIAFYDVLRRIGLARYRTEDNAHLDDWAALARSCGWWWPDEDVCVVVERPATIRTEPVPGSWYDEVRLRHDGRPAVEYRDGWRPSLR